MNSKTIFVAISTVTLVCFIVIFTLLNNSDIDNIPIVTDSPTGMSINDDTANNMSSNSPTNTPIGNLCQEKNWDCVDWSDCVSNQQKRTCTKLASVDGNYCFNGYEPLTINKCNESSTPKEQLITGASVANSDEFTKTNEDSKPLEANLEEQIMIKKQQESTFTKLKQKSTLLLVVLICIGLITTIIVKEKSEIMKLAKHDKLPTNSKEQKEINRIMGKYT